MGIVLNKPFHIHAKPANGLGDLVDPLAHTWWIAATSLLGANTQHPKLQI